MEDFNMLMCDLTSPFDEEREDTQCHQKICKFLQFINKTATDSDRSIAQNDSFLADISTTVINSQFEQRLRSSLEQHCDDITSAYIETIKGLAHHAMLSAVQGNEDEVYSEEHFTSSQENTSALTCIIKLLLDHLWECLKGSEDGQKIGRKFLKACAPPCILLCASHRNLYPWTSPDTMEVTEELLQLLCKMTSSSSISDLLNGSPKQVKTDAGWMAGGCYGDTLSCLRPCLTRQTWKQEPSSRHAFYWCLLQVKHPHLGHHVEAVLPPALLFADDYKVENKILGMKCLIHIIENVDPTELKWYGRGLVIYEALQHHLYNQDPALLEVLYPCILGILGVIEKAPHRVDEIRKPNRYDTVFQTILTNMEFEQKLVLRRAHAKCLAGFINKMAITVLRHMKRLLRVLVNYLEVYDGAEQTTRLDILRALRALIIQAWPRIPNHCDAIMKALLKLLYDITTGDSEDISQAVQSELVSHIGECLLLLKRSCGSHVDRTLQSVQGCEASNQLIDRCLQTVVSGT